MTTARPRIVRSRATPTPDTTRLRELLVLAGEAQHAASSALAAAHDAAEEFAKELRKQKVRSFSAAGYLGELVTPSGRSTNTVDARAFRKLVDDDDFYASIAVSVSAAKKVLPQKALDKITTTTPGKPGAERVEIKEAK